MKHSIGRRRLLAAAGAALAAGGLGACRSLTAGEQRRPAPLPALQLPALHASTDRITRITVCTRPFRPLGPRIEAERVGPKTVVHNYGHGGSGWSLSWGSSAIAAHIALETGERDIAVIGCGALGLTSALQLQRAGARVTIYAKELPPDVRSSLASGLWTPDSRICFDEHADAAFKRRWESMARESFKTYQSLLGLPGDPVEFIDSYAVWDAAAPLHRGPPPGDARPKFAELQRELIPDLSPDPVSFAPGSHPFGPRYLRRNSLLMFNLAGYARMLFGDFLANGGKVEVVEFHTAADLVPLPQRTLVNATGYGARELFDDRSLVPVRGQLARMIPQPDVHYGLFYRNTSFVPRRDGLVFQSVGEDDYFGFGDAGTAPDRAEAEGAVNTIAALFAAPAG